MSSFNTTSIKQLEQVSKFDTGYFLINETPEGTFLLPGKYFILQKDNVSFSGTFAAASATYAETNKQFYTSTNLLSSVFQGAIQQGINSVSATIDNKFKRIFYSSGILSISAGSLTSNTVTITALTGAQVGTGLNYINSFEGIKINLQDINLNYISSYLLPVVSGAAVNLSPVLTADIPPPAPSAINLFGYRFTDYLGSSAVAVSANNVFGFNTSVSAQALSAAAGIRRTVTSGTSAIGWTTVTYAPAASSLFLALLSARDYFVIPVYASRPNTQVVITGVQSPFSVVRSVSGPTHVGLAYNFTNTITTSTSYVTLLTGAQITVPTSGRNIAPDFNGALSANNISIAPQTTAYIFIVPLSSTSIDGTFTLSAGPDTSRNDLQFLGYTYRVPTSIYQLQARIPNVMLSAVNVGYNIKIPY